MACAAGLRDIRVGYFRFGIAGRKNGVDVAVAILALGDVGVARSSGFGMDALIVSRLLIAVAGCALGHGRRGFVRERLDVGVAIGAAEGAVNGRLKSSVIDVQTDLFAIFIFGQGGVIVTGQALIVTHLGSSFRLGCGHRERSEQQKKCKQPTATLHGIPHFHRTTQPSKMADSRAEGQ